MAETQQSTSFDADLSTEPALGQRTTRGLVWMIGQTFVGKISSIGGQILIAWFLRPSDFGLVGLAYAVAGLPSLLRDAGLPITVCPLLASTAATATRVFQDR